MRHAEPAGRWTQLALIALVEILAMGLWFAASAVVPELQKAWGITGSAAAWLTYAVQLGFVAGAIGSAVLNLADRCDPRHLIAGGAFLGAASTAAVALVASELELAVLLRFATGVGLAAVYPVGVKLLTSWFRSGLGLAVGTLVGALSVGSAAPHLLRAFLGTAWQEVLLMASVLALCAAVIAIRWLQVGPLATQSRPLMPGYALQMLRHRAERLVNIGYLGHMWELYALWTWMAMYIEASAQARTGGIASPIWIGTVTFAAIGVAGFVGCVLAGRVADRRGRPYVMASCLAVSGMCCVLSTVLFGTSPVAVTVLMVVWGAAVIADSGQYSAALSEVAEPGYVGTALTIQMAAGFLLTLASIGLVVWLSAAIGWRFAFLPLAAGPLIGLVAVLRFGALRPVTTTR